MGRSMNWTSEMTWLTVWSSAPHSQAEKGAIPHLRKQERESLTSVQRWLSQTHAVLDKAIPGWVPVSKVRSVVVLCNHSHSISDSSRAPHVCCCQLNWWAVVWREQMGVSIWDAVHSHSVDRWALSGAGVQVPWRGVAVARDSVAPLRWNSACWVPPAKIGRYRTHVSNNRVLCSLV